MVNHFNRPIAFFHITMKKIHSKKEHAALAACSEIL